MSLSPGSWTPRHVERFREHWKSLVGFGILSAILGVLALILSVTATIATVLVIGVFMAAAGLLQLALGFRTRSWGRFFAFELAGVVYLIAGVFAIFAPLEASVVLTLLLGAGLIATAASRLFVAIQMNGSPSRTTLILAAIITGLLGLMIVLGWPTNSLFILGTLLGIDLLFQGVVWTTLGFRIRPAA